VNAVHAALNFEDPALPDVELPLATPRLLLEPLKAADARELVHVLADRTLYSFIGGEPPDLIALSQRFQLLETRSSPDGSELWLNWTVRLRETHEAIGYVQATVSKDSTATIAYLVGTPWQHLGLASEAVRAMVDALGSDGVKNITAHIATGHVASVRVAEAAGLQSTTFVTDEGESIWTRRPKGRRHT
jgi:RimJ/RimL family protein N-acetyltransferase